MTERIVYKLYEQNLILANIAETLQDINKNLEKRNKEDEQ